MERPIRYVIKIVNDRNRQNPAFSHTFGCFSKFSKQSGNVKTDYQYYTQNAHGDIVNLTDAQGAITKSYKYDAFGVEQNIDDSDSNAFRYCGEYYDAETGTIYLRARYYNPTIGRFISRDSYAGENTDPLSLNRYTYCANNPIFYIDPSGKTYYYFYGKDQKTAYEINSTQIRRIYGEDVQGIYVNSDLDFSSAWNSIDMTYSDSVIINLHGNEDGVANMKLDEMDSKEIGYLYLLSCQSGHQDVENNVASQLFDHSSINALVACDGKHYREPIGGTTVVHSVPGDNIFRFIKNGNLGNYRVSQGFVLYTEHDKATQTKSLGHVFPSIVNMISQTKKEYEKSENHKTFSHASTGNEYYDNWRSRTTMP